MKTGPKSKEQQEGGAQRMIEDTRKINRFFSDEVILAHSLFSLFGNCFLGGDVLKLKFRWTSVSLGMQRVSVARRVAALPG